MDKIQEMDFPSGWDEVQPKEWEYLLRLFWNLKSGKYLMKDLRLEWVRFVLSNRGMRTARVGDKVYFLIYNLANSLAWMFQEDKDENGNVIQVGLNFDSTYNLLPRWKNLVGPMDHGQDLTFGEFRYEVAAMNDYTKTGNGSALSSLCGMLYRRSGGNPKSKDFDGHFRQPFSPGKHAYYLSLVKDMPDWMKWGVYAWFASFCAYLMEGVFIVDGVEVCFAEIFGRNKNTDSDSGETPVHSLGMNDILYTIAESGVFGNAQAVDDTLLIRVMMKLLSDKWKIDNLKKH